MRLEDDRARVRRQVPRFPVRLSRVPGEVYNSYFPFFEYGDTLTNILYKVCSNLQKRGIGYASQIVQMWIVLGNSMVCELCLIKNIKNVFVLKNLISDRVQTPGRHRQHLLFRSRNDCRIVVHQWHTVLCPQRGGQYWRGRSWKGWLTCCFREAVLFEIFLWAET